MSDKNVLHFPDENNNKMLIGVSDITSDRIKKISSQKNLTYSALISLAVELLDNMTDDVLVVMK